MSQAKDNYRPRMGQVEFVVDQTQDGLTRRYEADDNPCPDDLERECAEWVEERLTAVYNS